jgi:hypothetical protein
MLQESRIAFGFSQPDLTILTLRLPPLSLYLENDVHLMDTPLAGHPGVMTCREKADEYDLAPDDLVDRAARPDAGLRPELSLPYGYNHHAVRSRRVQRWDRARE